MSLATNNGIQLQRFLVRDVKMRAVLNAEEESGIRRGREKHFFRWLGLAGGIVVVGVAAYLWREWPFTQANVVKQLQQATSSTVQIGQFRQTFFPHPGCVARDVQLQRGSNPEARSTLTIKKLTIQGRFTGLFTKRIALIQAEGAEAVFPPLGEGSRWQPTDSDVVVDEFTANGATLEFTRHAEKKAPVTFKLHEFVAHHLAAHDPMKFEIRLQNPAPPGEIKARGTFGPWKKDQVGATPVAGDYAFRNADLNALGGIHGILASDGQFQGTLESIAVEGTTEIPDFAVRGSSHRLGLKSQFRAKVDAMNGDVMLDKVSAQLMKTRVLASGSVASKEHEHGKTASLDLAVQGGRIEDLLLLFVSAKRAPLTGTISLKAKAEAPPGNEPFLKKLAMTGNFGIEGALFTKKRTQEDLDKLSAAAQGEKDQPDDAGSAISDLQGHVVVRDGVATFSDLSFRVPGALARLHGTFDLTTERVNLRGVLLMQSNLPQATSGIKSFLLKAIDPFLKKNRRGGARIPITITGTYEHPVYKSDPV
jgi:hypothetical protein